jgi:transposase
MDNRDTRSLSGDAQEALRMRAVNAVLSGRKQVEVAAFFGISRQALSEWLKAYALHGQKGLQAKPKGRHAGGRILNSQQASQICQAIKERCPDHFNLPFYLWTREAVVQFIAQKYSINVSIWTVKRYLENWGFTFAKPVIYVDESDTSIIGQWLRQDYPIIRQHAKFEKAIIFWSDKVELYPDRTMETQHHETEQSPANLHAENETPYSMIYAITNLGQFNFMVFKSNIHTEEFIIFLDRLIKQENRKIFLLINGHDFINEKHIKPWMENNCDKIKLHFLPG